MSGADSPSVHFDDALGHLEGWLANCVRLRRAGLPLPRNGNYDCDVWVPDLALNFWRGREGSGLRDNPNSNDLRSGHLIGFVDATWHLCQIGVLRPGYRAGAGEQTLYVHAFSLTAHGEAWVLGAKERAAVDPGRFVEALAKLSHVYSGAFLQRAREAASCYRTSNYLACCTMAGAAAEAILLELAIAKLGEQKALSIYQGRDGRRELTKKVIEGLKPFLQDRFKTLSGVVGSWRDQSAHGMSTTISAVEASMALLHLLQFSRLAEENWAALTNTDSDL